MNEKRERRFAPPEIMFSVIFSLISATLSLSGKKSVRMKMENVLPSRKTCSEGDQSFISESSPDVASSGIDFAGSRTFTTPGLSSDPSAN